MRVGNGLLALVKRLEALAFLRLARFLLLLLLDQLSVDCSLGIFAFAVFPLTTFALAIFSLAIFSLAIFSLAGNIRRGGNEMLGNNVRA
jgi:hypothetical protein